MKIKILSLAVLAGLTALIYSGIKRNQSNVAEASYQVRENNSNSASAQGAVEYWKSIRGSVENGEVKEEDYNRVIAQIENKRASRAGGIGLEFEPIGPTNIGGRTRGLVVDINDPEIIIAASVTGGVFRSLNGGNTWTTSFGTEKTLTTSYLTQGPDGVVYLATGAASFELAGSTENGNSTPKEPGIGIMKSIDQGLTWTLLESTEVAGTDQRFRTINEVKVSPIDAKIIAVATYRGLQVSFDGGLTWIDNLICVGGSGTPPFVGDINSLEFSLDGKMLWVGSDDGRFFYLDDISATNTCGFVRTEVADGWVTGSNRMKLSASVINPLKVYAALTDAGDVLIDIIESVDGGKTFKTINPNVPTSNPNFDIFGNSQAWYDLLFKVVPNTADSTRENIWIGGVDLWRFDGNWTQASVGGRANGGHNPFFVHVDHHIMTYNKKNPNQLYFGNDGGVFKSLDGGYEFFDVNKGYMTTQFYSIDIANFDYVIGGTQDNGNIIVSPLRPGDTDFGAVVFNENITNGDGFDCVVSSIADVKYTSAQYNNVGRGLIVDVKGGAACGQYCDDQGHFYTKLALWESRDDKTSKFFLAFESDTVADAIDLGTGIRKTFSGTIKPIQDAAEVILGSIEIGTIDDRLKYNGAGGFTGNGIGTLDETTMEFSVTFNSPPQLNAKVNAYYASNYKAGSVLNVGSRTAQLPIQHILTTNLEPGDVELIQDPVQSIIAMSTSQECLSGQSHAARSCSGRTSGIMLGRDAINTSEELKWLFVPGGSGYRMVFSPNGDKLFASVGGSVDRLNGINDVYTQDDADKVTRTRISGFGGGTVTGISIHPNDPETLLVTTGNYGITSSHVYVVTGAMGANPVARAVGGDLPNFPVYDAIFDMTNPDRVILGTDKGVWTTNDVWAASPIYAEENSTIGNFPVIDIDQQTLPFGEASNREVIYLGTHGRGIWKSGSVVTGVAPNLTSAKVWESEIKLFPNPAKFNIQIEYTVANPDEVTMRIYSIAGNIMKTITPSALEGENSINVSVNDLPSGTYFINLIDGNSQKVAKFIKM
ncbi:MAG: T9SS type A sorting domain-containing protein [Salibacteraceae bacterium]|nr:T9SS type A sorting domain-containing protein [Salibacteraceae bacterium]